MLEASGCHELPIVYNTPGVAIIVCIVHCVVRLRKRSEAQILAFAWRTVLDTFTQLFSPTRYPEPVSYNHCVPGDRFEYVLHRACGEEDTPLKGYNFFFVSVRGCELARRLEQLHPEVRAHSSQ